MNSSSPEPGLRAYLLGSYRTTAPGAAGRWRVERDLLDRSDGTRGTFSGVVLFTPMDDDGLFLREEGTMRWPSFTGPATREYVLGPTARSDALDVFFPDGRAFHCMSFTTEASNDTHWCDPDTYRVTYTYQSHDRFSYSWDVTGPRKDLLLVSHLERISP
ncbi:DUF6314 family protein [Pseudarthrobacter enclensis]|uniref:DUF6314 domain-containing protein n=1 Tax=Pseudarthrobacter enclensis TaxID=993070 RepID=A0ABT9RWR9_9MICC|nr:DUF6314 family protein [Pseudarthrobacter enclensis]MDP9889684.1 hypothetical protein [Pseudarthrobacter enclensis]